MRPYSGSKIAGEEVFLNQNENGDIQKGFTCLIDNEISLTIDQDEQLLFEKLVYLVKETQ